MNKNQLNMGCNCNENQVCQFCFEPDQSENDVEKQIINYCNLLPRCKATKTSTTGRKKGKTWIKAKTSERKGKSDLVLCYYGFYIEVEVKKPGEGVQSDDQKIQENDTVAAMGEYWLIDNFDDFVSNIKFFNLRFENSANERLI